MQKRTSFLALVHYAFRSLLFGVAIFLLYIIIYILLSLFDIPGYATPYHDNNAVARINQFFYEKSTSALKMTGLFRHKAASRQNGENEDLPNIIISNENVKNSSDQVYSRIDTENITFDSCLIADEKTKKILSYPILIRVAHEIPTTFTEINDDMTADRVFLLTPRIDCFEPDNFWLINEYRVQIYPPPNIKGSGHLTTSDIDTLKSSIDTQMGYLELEISRLMSRVESNHSKIITEIQTYMEKSSLPRNYITEMKEVFGNKSNYSNLDEYLSELTDNFRRLTAANDTYNEDLAFFEDLYRRCIKIDNTSHLIGGQNASLFDMLYKNRRYYFDNLILVTDSYHLSPIGAEIAYSHGDLSGDFTAEYGQNVTLPDGYNIPINRYGFYELNLLKCGNLIMTSSDKQQRIYNNITHEKHLHHIPMMITHIIVLIIAIVFVMTLQSRHLWLKWLFIPIELLAVALLYTILITASCLINLTALGIVSGLCLFIDFLTFFFVLRNE